MFLHVENPPQLLTLTESPIGKPPQAPSCPPLPSGRLWHLCGSPPSPLKPFLL